MELGERTESEGQAGSGAADMELGERTESEGQAGSGAADMELGERTESGLETSQDVLRTVEQTGTPTAPIAVSGPARLVAVGGVIGTGTASVLAAPVLLSSTISGIGVATPGAAVGGNGPTESAQIPVSTSGSGVMASVSAQDRASDSAMQVDPPSDATQLVPVPLSNGAVAVPTGQNHEATPMEVEPSCPGLISPPHRDPVAVHTAQHRYALWDHRLYCKAGTWDKWEEPMCETDGQMEESGNLEPLTHMLHEFLSSFYIKYGSFIPLSETDVLEHLKKRGNTQLLKNRKLDIPGEVCRYKAGLASASAAGFMVTYNKHTLSLEDLSTLEEQNWLNDQVINTYGELIVEATQHKVHFFNSFFHRQLVAKGYEGVKRWTKKVDLFSKSLLLVPIHLEIHWSLIAVDMASKTISYYDSQGIVFKHTIDNILKYLQSEAKEKDQAAYQKGWRMLIIKGIPQQKNDSDCGVFVLEYCRCLSMKQALRFSQNDMPLIRKRIYKELCDKRLDV